MSQIAGEMMLGASQHGVTTNDVASQGPGRFLLVVGTTFIGALLFGSVGSAFAVQGLPYLVAFGAIVGLLIGVGVEVARPRRVRQARELPTTTVPTDSGVTTGMFMDATAKKPLVDIEEASTAAGSFATDLSASLASSGSLVPSDLRG